VATPDDADGILAVGVARDIEDLGSPDWSLDDVRDELAEAEHAWVAEDGARVVAAALLAGGDARVLVHPGACGLGLGTRLRELVEGAAAAGTVVRQEVSGSNEAARALLEAAGYRAEQRYWRMVLPLGEPPGRAVQRPDGVSVRGYAARDDARAVHALVQDAFADIPGNVVCGFEEWQSRFAADLSSVAVAADGSLAGAVLCERWDDGQGYVAYLAAAREWRGRGLGRGLLLDALARMRGAGLSRAALGVNGRNESATKLYESVGMLVEWCADRYEKRLP
jgi:ribosomal protein S18 acetylase RimI-like enzyme